MKSAINLNKLFNVGEKITLSERFLSRIYDPGSWYLDCIDTQKRAGALTIERVNRDFINVTGTYGSWALNIHDINLYELEPYRYNPTYFAELLYAFANNQDKEAHQFGKKTNRNVSTPLSSAFSWASTPEGYDFWKCVSKGEAPDYSKLKEEEDISNQNQQETTQNINNKNVSNHEIRLQKQKAVIIRGKRPEGSRICYSKYKASIRSGQISYTACHC